MRILVAFLAALFSWQIANAQKSVFFPTEGGGVVSADLYGTGERGVVLAHRGRFNKESWAKQADTLVAAGFRVLAIDFRGYGKSHGPGDRIRAQYEKAPEPKQLIILDGSAHAQYLFQTDQGERVMREILRFLSAQ